MQPIPIYKIDAFTHKVFSGNPAAVCPLPEWLESHTMQSIAAENNLSETAFFVKEQDGFGLKWFTPEAEIDLCGHATLATAFVLFNHLNYTENTITFFTKSGKLTVRKNDDVLTLNFPAISLEKISRTQDVADAIGMKPIEVLGGKDILMAIFNEEVKIANLQPDFEKIKKLNCRILYATAPGDKVDFVSRVFAPAVGINEDPVTGSAHCCFTPYWSHKLGKKKLTAVQLSKRRGELECEDLGERVAMSGTAVLFSKGEIFLNS